MNVTLICWTPSPELLAAAAARLCYRDTSAISLMESLTASEVEHLLDVVHSSGHLSIVEHITFSFAIDGVSRVLTHQLVRHRVGVAFSQQSQRYATVRDAGHITPASISANGPLSHEYEEAVTSAIDLYTRLLDAGIPNEDARFVLPQAIATRLVMTVNLRALINMYRLDACLRSQWEMRHLMNAMKREIRRVSPRLARELKIKCFAQGFCDEAVMCRELDGRMPRRDSAVRAPGSDAEGFYHALAVSIQEEPACEPSTD